MKLKKKLVSLALAATLLVSVPVSAFATTGFNQSVFDGRDDFRITYDNMTSQASIAVSNSNQLMIPVLESSAVITVRPSIFLTDSQDAFLLMFDYLGVDWAGLNGIIIKIGDNRYSFSNCYTFQSVYDGYASESICFYMKKQTLEMMKDLSDHRDEEIRVRLTGSSKNIDFVLTDTVKDTLLDLYGLYTAGGGTRESNMFKITQSDTVHVEKNGKRVIGNAVTTVLDLATGHMPA